VALLIEQDVVWLDVPVHDVQDGVQVLQAEEELA
jgi:hypothetical protein